jgi:hypothetical protein
VPGILDAVGGIAKLVARGVLVVAAGLGVYSVVQGASLRDIRNAMEDRVAATIRSWWLPPELAGVADRQTKVERHTKL